MNVRALVTIACVITSIASVAWADVSPDAAAKATALFKAGQAIIDSDPKDRHQIDDACDKFAASLDLDPKH
jgi:hypothetical protein